MAIYNANLPADTDFIADGPREIRENQEELRAGQIVDAGSVKGLVPGNANGQIPISNGNVNANLNAEKLQGKSPSDFAPAGYMPPVATQSSTGTMSNIDKSKLDSIATGAEVNQVAFSNVLVNGTTIQADSKTDTLEMVAGANISLIPDATNDRVTINVNGKVANSASADTAISAGNADTVDGLHAGSFMRSDADTICTGRVQPTGGSGTAYSTAPIEIRTTATPRVGFHWPGVVASQIGMNSGGQVCVWDNPGTSYETFKAGTMYSFDKQVATTDLIPTSLPANGGTSDYATRLRCVSRGDNYNVTPNWDGTYWWLKGYAPGDAYHAPCAVGYATQASNADTVDGYHVSQIISGFDAGHSFAEHGYQKLSNGLIIQWGRLTVNNNWNTIINFPVTFPNVCGAINLTIYNPNGTPTSNIYHTTTGVKHFTTSGFYGGTNTAGHTCFWFAIGY